MKIKYSFELLAVAWASGKVTLPPGLDGAFEWKGARKPLRSGVNEV